MISKIFYITLRMHTFYSTYIPTQRLLTNMLAVHFELQEKFLSLIIFAWFDCTIYYCRIFFLEALEIRMAISVTQVHVVHLDPIGSTSLQAKDLKVKVLIVSAWFVLPIDIYQH